MQKWPYAGITYLAVDHLPFTPQQNHPAQKREYLTVEAIFASETTVMFFDHYAKQYNGQRSELDVYLDKLDADGWKLTVAGDLFEGKGYQFRRFQFRRTIA